VSKRRANREGSLFFSNSESVWIGEIVLPDGRKRRKRSKFQKVVRDWLDEQKKTLKEGTWYPKNRSDTVSSWIGICQTWQLIRSAPKLSNPTII